MYKIFSGANGYYVAWENGSGTHYQPQDNGSRIGWDREEAERELKAVKLRPDQSPAPGVAQ